MRIDLRYGEGSLPLEGNMLEHYEMATPSIAPEYPDLPSEVLRGLANPDYSDGFSGISPESTIAIVVEGDISLDDAKILLGSLFPSLTATGILPENVSVLIESPSLASRTINEVNFLLGDPISNGYRVEFLNPDKTDAFEYIGDTPMHATPLYVHSEFLKADFRIGLGTILPTPFGGATGGRMAILPGATSTKTRRRNLRLMATRELGIFDIESSASRDMAEAAQLGNLDLIINTVDDWRERVAKVVVGDPLMAWEKGVEVARTLSKSRISRRADISIVTAGGSRNDSTLFQAIDCLDAGMKTTRHGGVIILVAECAQGSGPEGLVRGVSDAQTERELILSAQTEYEFGMERARLLLRAMDSQNIVICSRLRNSLVEERLRCTPVRDPQEGLEVARGLVGSGTRVAVVLNGMRVFPKMNSRN